MLVVSSCQPAKYECLGEPGSEGDTGSMGTAVFPYPNWTTMGLMHTDAISNYRFSCL